MIFSVQFGAVQKKCAKLEDIEKIKAAERILTRKIGFDTAENEPFTFGKHFE